MERRVGLIHDEDVAEGKTKAEIEEVMMIDDCDSPLDKGQTRPALAFLPSHERYEKR